MSALAWVYPEKQYERIGATRWVSRWWLLKPGRVIPDGQDWSDHDIEEQDCIHKTQAAARAAARRMVDSGETFFGCATVVEQVVDWYVQEDGVAEWTDIGDSEEIS